MLPRQVKNLRPNIKIIIIGGALVLLFLALGALIFFVGLTVVAQIKFLFLSSSTNSPLCSLLQIILKIIILVKISSLILVPVFILRLNLLKNLNAKSELPNNCLKCSWFHGQAYGGNFLVCGMHPYGKEDCPDFSAR